MRFGPRGGGLLSSPCPWSFLAKTAYHGPALGKASHRGRTARTAASTTRPCARLGGSLLVRFGQSGPRLAQRRRSSDPRLVLTAVAVLPPASRTAAPIGFSQPWFGLTRTYHL